MPLKIVQRPSSSPSLDRSAPCGRHACVEHAACREAAELCRCPECEAALRPAGPKRGRSALGQALQHTQSLKLAIPDAPVAADKSMLRLRLPDDLSASSLDDLGKLYGQFSSLASYAEVQVAIADVEQTEAEDALENMQSIVTLRGVEGANATERKAAVSQDPQVVRASEAYQIAHAKYVLLTALFNGYDRSMRTVSREFARRGIDVK